MIGTRTSALALALLTVAGCGRTYERDPDQINARYFFKYAGECSSWLVSRTTGYRYCASPPFSIMPEAAAAGPKKAVTKASGPTDQASLMAHGEQVYTDVCATCHQANGQGLPGSFPPLAGAGSFYGDAQNHARIIVHGLSGPITVNGVAYNSAMPAQGSLTDYDVAAVATYERNSWGNADGVVLPEDVKAIR